MSSVCSVVKAKLIILKAMSICYHMLVWNKTSWTSSFQFPPKSRPFCPTFCLISLISFNKKINQPRILMFLCLLTIVYSLGFSFFSFSSIFVISNSTLAVWSEKKMQGFVVELKVCSKETKTGDRGVSGDREVKGDSRVREGWGIRGVRVSQSDNSVCLPHWFLGF